MTLLLATMTIGGLQAAETPTVLQPTDASFSPADRSALMTAIDDIDSVLREGYPVRLFRLSSAGWTDRDFVVFVAGYLASAGFTTAVVEKTSGGDYHMWILVEIQLESGSAWIPVEAVPSIVDASSLLGVVAWRDSGQTQFDPAYVDFDRQVELARHPTPTARIVVIGYPVINSGTAMHASTSQPSNVVAYLWSVEGDEQVYVETNASSFEYDFKKARKTEVTLVVVDRWGGRATATKTVDVESENDCGCG